MVDIEIQLVQAFHWSLYEIDLTDTLSLIPFIRRITGENATYCDQVTWL